MRARLGSCFRLFGNYMQTQLNRTFSIAPMLDWTDF